MRTSIRARPPSPSSPAGSKTSCRPTSSRRPSTFRPPASGRSRPLDSRETSPLTRCAISTPSCPWADSTTLSGCSRSRWPAEGRWAGGIGPRSSGANRGRPNTSATCPTPGSERSSPPQFDGCCYAKTVGRSSSSAPSPTPGGRGMALRCVTCRRHSESPDLKASRAHSRATVDLELTGPAPERITFRYPGAKQARADGRRCDIHDDVVSAPNFKRLVIDF